MKATYISGQDEDINKGETLDIRIAIECKPENGGRIMLYYDSLEDLKEDWDIEGLDISLTA